MCFLELQEGQDQFVVRYYFKHFLAFELFKVFAMDNQVLSKLQDNYSISQMQMFTTF